MIVWPPGWSTSTRRGRSVTQTTCITSFFCHRKYLKGDSHSSILSINPFSLISSHFSLVTMCRTFHKEHMSIEHAAGSCTEILGIHSEKAWDLSLFAKHQGFSCLGTWTREECLSMGEELISRNLDCRVIPFNGGGVSDMVQEDSYAPDDVSVSFLFSYSN